MNAEVIKAMNKKPQTESIMTEVRKWWSKNGYKVMRVILFPVWFASLAKERFDEWVEKRNAWDETRAKEIFDYYIPRKAEWDDEKKEFYFFDNGYGWSYKLAKRYLKRKDKAFWNTNRGWSGGKLRSYLIDTYELEGFTKEVLDCSDSWTELVFKMN